MTRSWRCKCRQGTGISAQSVELRRTDSRDFMSVSELKKAMTPQPDVENRVKGSTPVCTPEISTHIRSSQDGWVGHLSSQHAWQVALKPLLSAKTFCPLVRRHA